MQTVSPYNNVKTAFFKANLSPQILRASAAFAFLVGAVTPHSLSAQSVSPTVYMNVDESLLSEMNGVFVARNRLSRTGWDQTFFVGAPSASYPSRDILAYPNTGSVAGSSSYDFSLVYTASNSTYQFGLNNGAVSGNVSFRGNGPNSDFSYDASSKDLNYNIIHVYGASTSPGSSVSFSDLVFVPGVGLATSGLLEAAGNAAPSNQYDQWLAAPTGVNLADYDWAINARVTLNIAQRASDEAIKFEISTKQGTFGGSLSAVPEPSSIMLCAAGLISGLLRRRRN